MAGENKMKQALVRNFHSHLIKKILTLLLPLLLLISCDGFENFDLTDLDMGGDIRSQLSSDLSVTYSFYEYNDLNSNHIDKVYITGKSISESSFPKFEHEDTIIVGWNYLRNNKTGSTSMPSNYSLNRKGYIGSFTPGNSSESLYAVWKKKCTVTFVSNWPGVDIKTQVLPEGDLIQQPEIEYRHGYFRFWGWYTDPDFHHGFSWETPVTGDLTLYAKWQEVRTITYYRNSGSDYFERDYPINEPCILEVCNFKNKNGYAFLGWAESKSATAPSYYTGDNIGQLTSDMKLYAVWSSDIVTITYIDSSGTFANKTEKYGRGAHVQVGRVFNENNNWCDWLYFLWQMDGLNIAGYSASSTRPANFEYDSNGGWDSDGDNIRDANYLTITGNMTLYVYWQGISYDVHFGYIDDYGTLHEYSMQYVDWGECVPIPAEPVESGKVFDNWYRGYSNGGNWSDPSNWDISSTPFNFATRLNNNTLNGWGWLYLFAKFNDSPTGDITGSVTFAEVGISDISINESIGSGTITFTGPTGYTYTWTLDGNAQSTTGNTITITTTSLSAGNHDINLIATDGTNYYSWQGKITKN